MSDGRSDWADDVEECRVEAQRFNDIYPVGTRVLAEDPRKGMAVFQAVVRKAARSDYNGDYACVSLEYAHTPGDTHVVAVSCVKGKDTSDVFEVHWTSPERFNKKYTVGSRVLVKSLRASGPATGAQIVSPATLESAPSKRVLVRVRFDDDHPGIDHLIDADRVISFNLCPPLPASPVPSEPPVPEDSQTTEPPEIPVPEEGTRTWSEFFNESRYEVRHEVGTDKISVLYKGKAEPVSNTLVFFMLQTIRSLRSYLATAKQTIRDLRAELAEAKAPQAETPQLLGLSLADLCHLLGWQGGTIHQVREEIVARRSVVERLASILCKDDEKASYVESLHGPVEAVVWAAKETLKKLERAIQTNRAARIALCADESEALEDAAARVVAERDDLRAQLAKAPQAETPEEDPALPILRELRDHQVHGHAIDPDDHLVVYCRERGSGRRRKGYSPPGRPHPGLGEAGLLGQGPPRRRAVPPPRARAE